MRSGVRSRNKRTLLVLDQGEDLLERGGALRDATSGRLLSEIASRSGAEVKMLLISSQTMNVPALEKSRPTERTIVSGLDRDRTHDLMRFLDQARSLKRSRVSR